MMVLSPLDEQAYDVSATLVTYCKLFPLIMKDFLTRRDCQEMMKPLNLPVGTSVNTIVAVTTPSGPGAGTGLGQGAGQTSPIYAGGVPTAGSQALAREKEIIRDSGGAAAEGAIGSL